MTDTIANHDPATTGGTLVCVPFAGAGASFFRPWRRLAGPGLEILPVQLPGRERRIDDEPYRDVRTAAAGVLTDVLAGLTPGRPVVLFGHSLGAVLAFELAHRLADSGACPAGLLVSGSPGPWSPREQRATGLPDDEFLVRVARFAGYTHDALADPEMRELVLPVLRADVEMHETYRPDGHSSLPVPIRSLRGDADTLVSAAEASGWDEATTCSFRYDEVPGGHMYLTGDARPVLAHAAALAGGAG